jgi:hypothetical protein
MAGANGSGRFRVAHRIQTAGDCGLPAAEVFGARLEFPGKAFGFLTSLPVRFHESPPRDHSNPERYRFGRPLYGALWPLEAVSPCSSPPRALGAVWSLLEMVR